MKKTVLSFKYAIRGIAQLFLTQRNARIHLLALITVVTFGFWFRIEQHEWLWLLAASGFVLTAEGFNTSIEYLTDLACPDFSNQAGKVKDIAAGAVLLAALTAVVVGLIVFVPKIGLAMF
ncbi:MAG: diacylglycerol kinase family protein [Bacteroidia bacterium]|nr:diacylglycerol kinase family protein [Bacteroidia bacterium]